MVVRTIPNNVNAVVGGVRRQYGSEDPSGYDHIDVLVQTRTLALFPIPLPDQIEGKPSADVIPLS